MGCKVFLHYHGFICFHKYNIGNSNNLCIGSFILYITFMWQLITINYQLTESFHILVNMRSIIWSSGCSSSRGRRGRRRLFVWRLEWKHRYRISDRIRKHGSFLCLFGCRCIHGLLTTCSINWKRRGYGTSYRRG